MNVLIVGNGAREYSIALALKKSKKLNKLYFAPGNGSTCALGENLSIGDYEGLAKFAKKKSNQFNYRRSRGSAIKRYCGCF